jgi:hypothetical protein
MVAAAVRPASRWVPDGSLRWYDPVQVRRVADRSALSTAAGAPLPAICSCTEDRTPAFPHPHPVDLAVERSAGVSRRNPAWPGELRMRRWVSRGSISANSQSSPHVCWRRTGKAPRCYPDRRAYQPLSGELPLAAIVSCAGAARKGCYGAPDRIRARHTNRSARVDSSRVPAYDGSSVARTFDRRNPPRLSEVFPRCYRADDKADSYVRRTHRRGTCPSRSSRPGLDPYPDPYGSCFLCLMRLLEVPGERG